MPNDNIRDQLIKLADLAKESRKLKLQAETKEHEFKDAFIDFFNANREYVFQNAMVEDGENPPFRYVDASKQSKALKLPLSLSKNAFVSCSCGSRIDSCDDCGDGHYSYFTISDDAQILRLKMDK